MAFAFNFFHGALSSSFPVYFFILHAIPQRLKDWLKGTGMKREILSTGPFFSVRNNSCFMSDPIRRVFFCAQQFMFHV